MPILRWKFSESLRREAEVNYRTTYALGLQGRPALDIIRDLTFDGSAPRITVADLERLLRWIERCFLKKSFFGIGVEVGSGPLVFCSVLARFARVTTMYGVEICAPIIEKLYPAIAREIAGAFENKAVGVVGSFDDMALADGSVDFVFDFFSLHHSLDIRITLRELARVLKPGGFVLMLDKARPDSYSEEDLDELLDAKYGPEYNRHFGLPEDQNMTRRLNGEREYRLKDWHAAFSGAGFGRFDYWRLEKASASGIGGVVKRIIATLPPKWQPLLTGLLPGPKQTHAFILHPGRRVFTPLLENFRKEMSLMVAYKK